jgi:hypothetical protein
VVSRTVIAPIERTKIMFQIQKESQGSIIQLVTKVLQREGPMSFWKGNLASVTRVIPYMGIQFVSYERYKAFAKLTLGSANPTIASLLAGSGAGLTAVAATYPLDTVRARMAMQAESGSANPEAAKRGMWQTLTHVFRMEGVGALYSGCYITMVGVAPYAGLKFGTYELLKAQMQEYLGVEEKEVPVSPPPHSAEVPLHILLSRTLPSYDISIYSLLFSPATQRVMQGSHAGLSQGF